MNDQPSARDVLLKAMAYGLHESGWHASLLDAVRPLSAERAKWRPAPDRNSIHDIVRHVTHWKRKVLEGWEAMSSKEAFEAYEAFDWQRSATDDASWDADLAELESVSRALLDAVAAMDDVTLASPDPGGRQPRLFNYLNVATHDAYHAGQVRTLVKMQEV